ncbi:MAG: hypothetical protein AB1810_09685 [Pseudomonadota bacterium]
MITIQINDCEVRDALRDEAARRGMDQYITIGLLARAESEAIARMTGVEAVAREMYDWTVNADAPRHIFGEHGDETVEAPRGQRAVTAADYTRLPAAILNGAIEDGGRSWRTKNPLVRARWVDGEEEIVAVFEAIGGRRMLTLDTMYVIRRRPR